MSSFPKNFRSVMRQGGTSWQQHHQRLEAAGRLTWGGYVNTIAKQQATRIKLTKCYKDEQNSKRAGAARPYNLEL